MPRTEFLGRATLTFIVMAIFIFGLAVIAESHLVRDLAIYIAYVTAFFAFWWMIYAVWEPKR